MAFPSPANDYFGAGLTVVSFARLSYLREVVLRKIGKALYTEGFRKTLLNAVFFLCYKCRFFPVRAFNHTHFFS